MIYGRFGDKVIIKRMAVLSDVKVLDLRDPDKEDRSAIMNGSYVVVVSEDGMERLYHLAYLRADGGSKEISDAIDATKNRVK